MEPRRGGSCGTGPCPGGGPPPGVTHTHLPLQAAEAPCSHPNPTAAPSARA